MTAHQHCDHCIREAQIRAGLGPGPYTPLEYTRLQAELGTPAPIVSPPIPEFDVAGDPAVKAAAEAAEAAELAFAPYDEKWLDATAAVRRATIAEWSSRDDQEKTRLAKVTAEADKARQDACDARDAQWLKVVKARELHRRAQVEAIRARAIAAQRSGR